MKVETQDPKVVIIIVNWNGKLLLTETLASVAKLTYLNVAVVVVDNCSDDGSAEAVHQNFPEFTLIENDRNLGFAGGNNVGIRWGLARSTEYFFLLNNDVEIDPDALSILVERAESHPFEGIFGPKTYKYYARGTLDFVGGMYSLFTGITKSVGDGEKDVGQYDEPSEFDFINGHAFLIKREVIDKIGLLDEDYFAYNEETDWCLRARRTGYKCIYVPDAIVWHKVSSTPIGVTREFLIMRNRILCVRKHANWFQMVVFCLHLLGYQLPRNFFSALKHKRPDRLVAVLKGVLWHFGFYRQNNPLSAISYPPEKERL